MFGTVMVAQDCSVFAGLGGDSSSALPLIFLQARCPLAGVKFRLRSFIPSAFFFPPLYGSAPAAVSTVPFVAAPSNVSYANSKDFSVISLLGLLNFIYMESSHEQLNALVMVHVCVIAKFYAKYIVTKYSCSFFVLF